MIARLYLTDEERLRLKKLIERVSPIFLHDDQSSLSFQVARRRLKNFIEPLSPISKTRDLIEKILSLTEKEARGSRRKEEVALLLNSLLAACARGDSHPQSQEPSVTAELRGDGA